MVDKTRPHDYYSEEIDFDALAQHDEDFGVLWRASDKHLDWQHPGTVRALTKAILKHDFDLRLTLPGDRLTPPIPVRYNYIRWMQELVDTTGAEYTDAQDDERTVVGLDIGVGASCIYGLLACASRSNWRMLGTDIDEYSLKYAQKNVDDNDLEDRIRLKLCRADAPPIPDGPDIDFIVCNPPFYESEDEMRKANGLKELPASAVCTGSTNEMICAGGDLGFASRMLRESLVLQERVQWYSCMFGRLESAKELVVKFKEHGITNFAATNLTAGQRTSRWAVAWSFQDYRPRNDVARHGSLMLALLPQATQRTVRISDSTAENLAVTVDHFMSKLDLQWRYDADRHSGLAIASGNVWSRSARRRKESTGSASSTAQPSSATAFAVRITCTDEQVDVRWLRGYDVVMIESFVAKIRALFGVRGLSRFER